MCDCVYSLPQVQKHMDMLRRERETAALVAVRDAFPDLGAAVCIVALEVGDPLSALYVCVPPMSWPHGLSDGSSVSCTQKRKS